MLYLKLALITYASLLAEECSAKYYYKEMGSIYDVYNGPTELQGYKEFKSPKSYKVDFNNRGDRPGICVNGDFVCNEPYKIEDTQIFECEVDFQCPSFFKCCHPKCFQHKICQPLTYKEEEEYTPFPETTTKRTTKFITSKATRRTTKIPVFPSTNHTTISTSTHFTHPPTSTVKPVRTTYSTKTTAKFTRPTTKTTEKIETTTRRNITSPSTTATVTKTTTRPIFTTRQTNQSVSTTNSISSTKKIDITTSKASRTSTATPKYTRTYSTTQQVPTTNLTTTSSTSTQKSSPVPIITEIPTTSTIATQKPSSTTTIQTTTYKNFTVPDLPTRTSRKPATLTTVFMNFTQTASTLKTETTTNRIPSTTAEFTDRTVSTTPTSANISSSITQSSRTTVKPSTIPALDKKTTTQFPKNVSELTKTTAKITTVFEIVTDDEDFIYYDYSGDYETSTDTETTSLRSTVIILEPSTKKTIENKTVTDTIPTDDEDLTSSGDFEVSTEILTEHSNVWWTTTKAKTKNSTISDTSDDEDIIFSGDHDLDTIQESDNQQTKIPNSWIKALENSTEHYDDSNNNNTFQIITDSSVDYDSELLYITSTAKANNTELTTSRYLNVTSDENESEVTDEEFIFSELTDFTDIEKSTEDIQSTISSTTISVTQHNDFNITTDVYQIVTDLPLVINSTVNINHTEVTTNGNINITSDNKQSSVTEENFNISKLTKSTDFQGIKSTLSNTTVMTTENYDSSNNSGVFQIVTYSSIDSTLLNSTVKENNIEVTTNSNINVTSGGDGHVTETEIIFSEFTNFTHSQGMESTPNTTVNGTDVSIENNMEHKTTTYSTPEHVENVTFSYFLNSTPFTNVSTNTNLFTTNTPMFFSSTVVSLLNASTADNEKETATGNITSSTLDVNSNISININFTTVEDSFNFSTVVNNEILEETTTSDYIIIGNISTLPLTSNSTEKNNNVLVNTTGDREFVNKILAVNGLLEHVRKIPTSIEEGKNSSNPYFFTFLNLLGRVPIFMENIGDSKSNYDNEYTIDKNNSQNTDETAKIDPVNNELAKLSTFDQTTVSTNNYEKVDNVEKGPFSNVSSKTTILKDIDKENHD